MDATEIIALVSGASTLREHPDLIRDLGTVSPKLLFDTLFPFAVKQKGINCEPVAFSAYVIHAIILPCPLTPSEVLSEMVIQKWEISIEEVPWYLANQFGAYNVLACVIDALDDQTDDSARTRLKTVRYWVVHNPKSA